MVLLIKSIGKSAPALEGVFAAAITAVEADAVAVVDRRVQPWLHPGDDQRADAVPAMGLAPHTMEGWVYP
jgi:hypothetical protein